MFLFESELLEHPREPVAGVGGFDAGDLFRSAGGYDLAADVAAFGA